MNRDRGDRDAAQRADRLTALERGPAAAAHAAQPGPRAPRGDGKRPRAPARRAGHDHDRVPAPPAGPRPRRTSDVARTPGLGRRGSVRRGGAGTATEDGRGPAPCKRHGERRADRLEAHPQGQEQVRAPGGPRRTRRAGTGRSQPPRRRTGRRPRRRSRPATTRTATRRRDHRARPAGEQARPARPEQHPIAAPGAAQEPQPR